MKGRYTTEIELRQQVLLYGILEGALDIHQDDEGREGVSALGALDAETMKESGRRGNMLLVSPIFQSTVGPLTRPSKAHDLLPQLFFGEFSAFPHSTKIQAFQLFQ